MKKVGLLHKATGAIAAAIAVVVGGAVTQAQAQTSNTIFPANWENSVKQRMFMRISYVGAFVKTKSGEAYDVTGPVLSTSDFPGIETTGNALPASDFAHASNFDLAPGSTYGFALGALSTAMREEGRTGLGTPKGIKAKASDASTIAVSIGYWLDDYWSLEAYLLAAPLKVKAKGDGLNETGTPNGLNGKEIVTTKLLPPLAIIGRSFGNPKSFLRPYLGVGAMYAVFFDTKVSPAFDGYLGGGTNKTSASLKNAFGVGPFIGLKSQLDEDWHFNLSVGQIILRTQATLTTRNSEIKTGAPVLADYSSKILQAIDFSEHGNRSNGRGGVDSEFTTKLMHVLAKSKGQDDLGTYVRKQDQKLTNTIVSLSVGRSF